MSRIGIKPISLQDVSVQIAPTTVTVSGPKGNIVVALPYGVKVTQKDTSLLVAKTSDARAYRALHGTVRSLLQNAVTGVKDGFERRLELIGIGFRAALESDELVLQVGYTHPVKLKVPAGIQAKIEKNVIVLSSSDKHSLGQFAANLRAVRKPDPYKGKGIRYQGEKIRMKQGKAVKAGAA